eukprot:4678355-Alexandrium_andersonii.AAC.1
MCIRDRPGTPPFRRGPASEASSGVATPTGLRRMIDEEFDPAVERSRGVAGADGQSVRPAGA